MIKKLTTLSLALLLVLLVLSPVAWPALAEGPGTITVTNSAAAMDFPLALNFSARINGSVNIADIRLKYKIDQMSFADVTSEAVITFQTSPAVNASYKLDLRKTGGLPPGTRLKYWWQARDAAGAVLESPSADFQITDNRYKWRTSTQGKVNLFWYQGDDAFAGALMSSAQNALVKLQKDTGASPDRDINIYIYADSNALQGSMIYPNEWTGGVAFTQYSIIAIGINPSNLSWGQEAMAHELTHNVINQVTFNPYSELPVWLNEGLAMHNQGPLSQQFTGPLAAAVAASKLFSVRSLCSPFSAYADKASLSYAESARLVEYLITQYGSDQMLKLLSTFKQGSTYDDALQTVYGFDIEGLDAKWKSWIALQYGASGTK
jgi:acyl-CoA-binding protein